MVSLPHILQGPPTMANLDFCHGERGGRSSAGVERDSEEGMTRGLGRGQENAGGGRENNQVDFWVVSLAQQEWVVAREIWRANKFIRPSR